MMNSVVRQASSPANATPQMILADDKEIDLVAYLNILAEQRWLIIAIALTVSLLGVLYAFVAKPVYEANLLIHVEEKGQREPKNILGEAGSMMDTKTAASAEIELLRSRLVVAKAIDNLRLYIDARPVRFPLIGNWIADIEAVKLLPKLQGLGGYAWGREEIEVTTLNLPELLENRPFILKVVDAEHYAVTEKSNDIRFVGTVGETVTVGSKYGPIDLLVTRLKGTKGTEFQLNRSSRLAAITSVKEALNVNELGKQSGILSATLKGDNASGVFALLTEIGKQYMAQNGARRTEEADKSLAFLNRRLPELKQQLEQAEARYNQFRNANGTVDLGEEARINLKRSADARTRRIEMEQKRTELMSRFTANHPAVVAVDTQLKDINREIREAAMQIKTLPVMEQELVKLSRDVKVNSELYSALLASAQQLQLITVGKTSNVRLVDAPLRADRPVSPNRPRIIAIAVFLGIFVGILVAFIRRSLQSALEDPEQVESMFGMPVYAAIPHSKIQKSLTEDSDESSRLPLLARIASMDIAVESLRNFRAALQFSMAHAVNNIVLITGPTAGMGKSFVSANLAAIVGASGRKVLLIDADLREGQLHRYFSSGRVGGLSDLLAEARPVEDLLRKDVIANVDFISTGSLPPDPSELLLRPSLAALLQELAPRYDLVLIDGTPILAVSDSLIVGTHAGAIYVTVRSGVTTPGEIAESLKRLARAGLSARGMLFNDHSVKRGRYGYGYRYGKYRQLSYVGHPRAIEAPAAH